MIIGGHVSFSINRILLLKILFASIAVCMTILTIRTCLQSNLFEVLPALNSQPWFTATIIDFYFNISILSAWVIYKEKNFAKSAGWIISFIALGSIATAFYVFVQLCKLKNGETLDKIFLRS